MEKSIRLGALLAASFLVLNASAATGPSSSPEIGSWLDGIQTHYVSQVLFDDVAFNRYLPVNNPYQVVQAAFAALPPEKVDHAIATYGSHAHDGIAPFFSDTAPHGQPSSGLFQRADYRFIATCGSCPDRLSFGPEGIGFTFKPAAGKESGRYVSLNFAELNEGHFAMYPFLREVLEIQALMLDSHNAKSYAYRRAKALHQGAQAVLNFAGSSSVELSDYTKTKLDELRTTSINSRLRAEMARDLNQESATPESTMAIGANFDPYPYQTISGKHVLLRAILDSIFASGETKNKAALVVENYRLRNAYANRLSQEFHNERQYWPKDLGPRPKFAKPYPWWNEMSEWFSSAPFRPTMVTCESIFVSSH
jgi:hypothetical protein